MKGIGYVYRQYRSGVLTDDEEVAILHEPEEVGYVPLTEAMVNVRATIQRALEMRIVEPSVAAELVRIAKSLFYKDRTYQAVLSTAADQGLGAGRAASIRDVASRRPDRSKAPRCPGDGRGDASPELSRDEIVSLISSPLWSSIHQHRAAIRTRGAHRVAGVDRGLPTPSPLIRRACVSSDKPACRAARAH